MLLASERANGRIERVARGQGHHCILRFTLCHQSAAAPPHPSALLPPLLLATFHFLFSATPALSVILELRYSDIACGVVPLSVVAASSPANQSPSSIKPFKWKRFSSNGVYNPYAGYFFRCFHSKIVMGVTYPHDSFELCKLSFINEENLECIYCRVLLLENQSDI